MYSCHLSNDKIQANISLSIADNLLSASDMCITKYSTGCHSLSISYSKIAPVVKLKVSAKNLLGKVGSKMLSTGV